MERSYFSKAFNQTASAVWVTVRDFAEYRWGEGVGEARIEGGGDAIAPAR